MVLSHLLQIAPHLADASGQISTSAKAACGTSCGGSDLGVFFGKITNALVYLIGAISVVMIIIGGLRYVLSNGDPKSTESAKNTILYAVIGLIVAIAAFAIVTFVTNNIK